MTGRGLRRRLLGFGAVVVAVRAVVGTSAVVASVPVAPVRPATQPTTAPAIRLADRVPISEVVVRSVADDGRTVRLDVVSGPAVGPRGRIVLFDGGRPRGVATVDERNGAALTATVEGAPPAQAGDESAPLRAGLRGVALPFDAGRHARLAMQRRGDAALVARVEQVSESGRTAWVLGGGDHGFVAGDRLLAARDGWPLARLELFRVDRDHSLAAVVPLVANATLAAGDAAALWPAPGMKASGRRHTRVLRVEAQERDQEVWIPAAGPEFDRPGDRWTIYRDGKYVATAEVRRLTDRFALAAADEGFRRVPVEAGDLAVRRPGADVASGRAALHVFRTDDGYALVNAGEADGLRVGDVLTLLRRRQAVADLRITLTSLDHCGATVEVAAAAADAVRPEQWETVYVKPPRPAAEPRAILSYVWESRGLAVASAKRGARPIEVGQIVAVDAPGLNRGAIVVAVDADRVVLVPAGHPLGPLGAAGDAVSVEPAEATDRPSGDE